MILFIYFNPIIGPELLYSVPRNIKGLLTEGQLDQIKRLMDSANLGFFMHAFSSELQTANYFFNLSSSWARGNREMIMISKVLEEEAPNLNLYEEEFVKFKNNLIKNYPEIYQSVYIHNPPLDYQKGVAEQYKILTSEVDKLSESFSIVQTHTHGILTSFGRIKETKSIEVPARILPDMAEFLDEKKNYFLVFQKQNDSFRVNAIPYEGEVVLKILITFSGQLGPDSIRSIANIVQKTKMTFLFTGGICQKGEDCIYELYLNPGSKFEEDRNYNEVKEEILKIKNVKKVNFFHIQNTK